MFRFLSLLAIAAAVSAPAQTAAPVSCPPTPTLDQLITALDDAVSGPADKDRTCLRQIAMPNARLIPLAAGNGGPHILTVDDWIEAVRKRGTAVFYERQIKVQPETFGHIAHLWSTYEIRPTPDGRPTARGINSIQAVFDGQNWKVLEILWETASPSQPLPDKYLP